VKSLEALSLPFFCTLVALTFAGACSRPAGPIQISLANDDVHRSTVRVTGLSSDELSSLRTRPADAGEWPPLLSVRVSGADADAPPVAGRYLVVSDAVEFTPLFAFDPGRRYDVTFDPSKLPSPRAAKVVRESVGLPAIARTPSTRIVRMLPTADVLPENLLRVYLEFSAPMSRENGRDFIKLLDEHRREVPNAFLALDIEFWSPDYLRYSVFFDPGRVKRGILPNDEFGRALRAGHKFTLAVDPQWRDANGQPLAAPFERTFTVGPPDLSPMRLADWQLRAPAAGTRDPLVVMFPKPLDHGLLQRAIGVTGPGGAVVRGNIGVGESERTWTFAPSDAWRAGVYTLVTLSTLEDPEGNRIGRPFDIDTFERIDRSSEPERFTVPFTVK
jgi:hypothetical protein